MAKPMRVVFVLDTSASMRGPLNGALSALDAAKAAIEHFVTSRARLPTTNRQDQYVLVTCEGPQTSWNGSTEEFLAQMRQTRIGSSASMKEALDASLNFANRHRSPVLDNYGQGFVPWFIMPCLFIVLTDGSRDVSLPLSHRKSKSTSVQHFYSEFYRWDHRVHVAILTTGGIVQSPTRLADVCQITCGSFKICSSLRTLREFMEMLSQRSAPAILIRLVSSMASATCAFLVNQSKGNWPIPLPYLPEASSTRLECCSPIPEFVLKPLLTPIDVASLNLPYDRYEVETGQFPSNLMSCQTHQVLCHVRNSLGDDTDGNPFAVLTPTTLFVFPYNFPRLSRLVQESTGASFSQQIESWRLQLAVIPFYYTPALRMAFSRNPHLSHLVSEVLHGEAMTGCLSSQVKSQINRLIQSQQSLVDDQLAVANAGQLLPRPIPGRRPLEVIDPAHRIPVSLMGNYQSALASKVVLRDPFSDDSENGEQLREDAHFGSRYRKTKKVSRRFSLSVDEADSRADETQTAPAGSSTFRETIIIHDPDLQTPKASKPKFFVNHWKLASLFWSFTDLLLVSDFDPAYYSLLSNFKTLLDAARSHSDFDMLLQLCQEQALRYGNPNRFEILRP